MRAHKVEKLVSTVTKHAIAQEIDNEQAGLVHKCFLMALWSKESHIALTKFVNDNFDDLMK